MPGSAILLNRRVALVSAVLMAVSFWPLATSRQALRAGMLPFFMAGAVWFYWRMVARRQVVQDKRPSIIWPTGTERNSPRGLSMIKACGRTCRRGSQRGALPETLIESELFGHRKGAFTGADDHRTGLFEVASGGTIFLDEIGELPKSMQAKLLRVLESGEVRPVGDNEARTVDVRVVCATHRNLEEMVEDGAFREDLMFRINTFEVHLPALRERVDDIPLLAAASVLPLQYCRQSGR